MSLCSCESRILTTCRHRINVASINRQLSLHRFHHSDEMLGVNAVLRPSGYSEHHSSQWEVGKKEKVCYVCECASAKVPPSVLLLKPAACLRAAAVSARPRLFLRPCCSTASNCAHRQITLKGGQKGRGRTGWSLNTHSAVTLGSSPSCLLKSLEVFQPGIQWEVDRQKPPAGFCSGFVIFVEMLRKRQ